MDRRTDELLQDTLHRSFASGTILAVAHRLETVIDYDLILVLGNGKVLEFGSPAELLRLPEGAFASMVADTGEATCQTLHQRAMAMESMRKKTA